MFRMQNTHTITEKCFFNHLHVEQLQQLRSCRLILKVYKCGKNKKGVHQCPSYIHLLIRTLNFAYYCSNFVSKQDILFLSVGMGFLKQEKSSLYLELLCLWRHINVIFSSFKINVNSKHGLNVTDISIPVPIVLFYY